MDIRERLNIIYNDSKNNNRKPIKAINFKGINLDLSRNIITRDILVKMYDLLRHFKFTEKRKQLFTNKLFSNTESQTVSFVSYRNSKSYDKDIDKMTKLYLNIKNNKINNYYGEKITSIVHIGIGGSILGPKFLSDALEGFKDKIFDTYFVSSGDLKKSTEL